MICDLNLTDTHVKVITLANWSEMLGQGDTLRLHFIWRNWTWINFCIDMQKFDLNRTWIWGGSSVNTGTHNLHRGGKLPLLEQLLLNHF